MLSKHVYIQMVVREKKYITTLREGNTYLVNPLKTFNF